MTDVYEDDYETEEIENDGNICVKAFILFFFGIMVVVMLSVFYWFLVRVLGGPYYPAPLDLSTLLTFIIGGIFGYIVRDVTMKKAED